MKVSLVAHPISQKSVEYRVGKQVYCALHFFFPILFYSTAHFHSVLLRSK